VDTATGPWAVEDLGHPSKPLVTLAALHWPTTTFTEDVGEGLACTALEPTPLTCTPDASNTPLYRHRRPMYGLTTAYAQVISQSHTLAHPAQHSDRPHHLVLFDILLHRVYSLTPSMLPSKLVSASCSDRVAWSGCARWCRDDGGRPTETGPFGCPRAKGCFLGSALALH